MDNIISSPLFGILLSCAIYLLFDALSKKIQSPLLNPLLLSGITLIIILKLTGISYDNFNIGGSFITMLLGPATVALAIPLVEQKDVIIKHHRTIIIGIGLGIIVHSILIIILVKAFNFDMVMLASLLPKSVTTAIAKDISQSYGGIQALTIAVVIITGILGSALSPYLFKLFRIKHPIAQGLALGTAAHATGTAKAVELGSIESSMASIALILSGIITVVIAPLVLTLLA